MRKHLCCQKERATRSSTSVIREKERQREKERKRDRKKERKRERALGEALLSLLSEEQHRTFTSVDQKERGSQLGSRSRACHEASLFAILSFLIYHRQLHCRLRHRRRDRAFPVPIPDLINHPAERILRDRRLQQWRWRWIDVVAS